MAAYAEQEIINGCLKKDRFYEEYLYKQYYGIFLSVCMRYTPDARNAKQMLNDGFVKIFTSLAHYRYEGSFEGWMRRIMVNTCLMYLKSSEFKKAGKLVPADFAEHTDSRTVHNEALEKMDAQELLAMLQSLPPVTGAVFNLFVFDGYSHAEIAAMLGITASTSSWHVNRARTLLQQKITTKNRLYEHK